MYSFGCDGVSALVVIIGCDVLVFMAIELLTLDVFDLHPGIRSRLTKVSTSLTVRSIKVINKGRPYLGRTDEK